MTTKNALVIAAYFGQRRRRPKNALETYRMMKFYVNAAQIVDPGVPCDVILSCNLVRIRSEIPSLLDYKSCLHFAKRLEDRPALRGRFRVIFRDNIGLSFGAYSEGFMRFREEYEHFCFTEDDWIFVRDGYYARAIEQIQESDGRIGAVAMASFNCEKIIRRFPPYARGGIIAAPTGVLNRLAEMNVSARYPEGRLSFRTTPNILKRLQGKHRRKAPYYGHALAEVEFSSRISDLGLEVVNLDMEAAIMGWKYTPKWGPRYRQVASWPPPERLLMR